MQGNVEFATLLPQSTMPAMALFSLPDFRVRADEPELMDDLALGGATIRQTLDQLAVVNRLLGGHIAWQGVRQVLRHSPGGQPLELADLGCGGGDSLRQIARWAKAAGVPLRLIGFDANPHVVAYAREKSHAYPSIRYEVADITSDAFLQRRFDLLTASLVLHHFDHPTLAHLLPAYLRMATRGLVISDLQRHWLPWSLFALVTRLCGASPMIRHDGLLSVRRGFTQAELRAMLTTHADAYTLRWRWAFRYLAVAKRKRDVGAR